MTLSSLLTVGQIIPEMKATERWPAITEIVDLLVSTQRIEPQCRDSVLAALKQREETMSTGIGFGIDRLAMLLTNQASIQEVLFFPQMRPEKLD